MDQDTVITIAQNALMTVIYVSAPLLLVSLIVGLAVSVFRLPHRYRRRLCLLYRRSWLSS